MFKGGVVLSGVVNDQLQMIKKRNIFNVLPDCTYDVVCTCTTRHILKLCKHSCIYLLSNCGAPSHVHSSRLKYVYALFYEIV